MTVDGKAGADGIDTVWNIEKLQFADTTLPVAAAPQRLGSLRPPTWRSGQPEHR